VGVRVHTVHVHTVHVHVHVRERTKWVSVASLCAAIMPVYSCSTPPVDHNTFTLKRTHGWSEHSGRCVAHVCAGSASK
jgi:hypothetical protein